MRDSRWMDDGLICVIMYALMTMGVSGTGVEEERRVMGVCREGVIIDGGEVEGVIMGMIDDDDDDDGDGGGELGGGGRYLDGCYLMGVYGWMVGKGEKEVGWLDCAGDGGHGDAMRILGGGLVAGGDVGEEVGGEGRGLLRRCCEKGNLLGMALLGEILEEHGELREAWGLFETSAKGGCRRGVVGWVRGLWGGWGSLEKGDWRLVMGLLEEGVRRGDAESRVVRGVGFLKGFGGNVDVEKGVEDVREGAGNGCVFGMKVLGEFLRDGGQGVEGKEEGRMWLRKYEEAREKDGKGVAAGGTVEDFANSNGSIEKEAFGEEL